MLRADGIEVTGDALSVSRLKAIVERAAKETGASYGFLLLYDLVTQELHKAVSYGKQDVPEDFVAVARSVMARKNYLSCEGAEDSRETGSCSLSEPALPITYVPVISGDTPRGVLGVGSLSPSDDAFLRWLPLLECLAELSAVVVEKHDLQRELLRKEEQVRDLIRDTLGAQEAERERVCLEVHDGVAQTLASAFQYLQSLETTVSAENSQTRQLLLKATALVKQAIQESRDVINSLQPATLMDLGLVATLRHEMRQLEQETGWRVDFDADAVRLPKGVETGLYRLVHEAITNAKRHSHTKRLRVRIASEDCRLKVEVKDWGVGFYLPPIDRRRVHRRRGTGLFSMRKRAELLQGTCDIQTNPGQGTTVRVELPLGSQTE